MTSVIAYRRLNVNLARNKRIMQTIFGASQVMTLAASKADVENTFLLAFTQQVRQNHVPFQYLCHRRRRRRLPIASMD